MQPADFNVPKLEALNSHAEHFQVRSDSSLPFPSIYTTP